IDNTTGEATIIYNILSIKKFFMLTKYFHHLILLLIDLENSCKELLLELVLEYNQWSTQPQFDDLDVYPLAWMKHFLSFAQLHILFHPKTLPQVIVKQLLLPHKAFSPNNASVHSLKFYH